MHFTAALLVLCGRAATAQPAAGPEFLVGSYTTGAHANPAVAADAHGNFVAVWERDGGVFGQRFTAAGVRRGAEFEVSPSGGFPKVAANAEGAFVVSWHASVDGSGLGVQARRFDASGTPLGGALAVNTYTTGTQGVPAIAADAAGNFVVAWQSAGQDGAGYGVFARRFDAAGGPLGDEVQVSSSVLGPFGDQAQPALAAQANGSFVVAWTSRVSFFAGSEYRGVLARRYDAAGAPIGAEFAATETTSTRPSGPDVALDGAGNFVVAWSETFGGFPLPSGTVVARRFDASGAPLSGTFGVPEATSFSQGGASVGMDLAGNFTIAWQSRAQEGEPFFHGVYAQRFDPAGARVGSEFRVNTYTTGDQRSAAVVSGPDENFTVLWQGPREGIDVQVLGQRYGDVIFRDGFPAEGLGRWSAVAADGGDLQVSAAAGLDGSPTGLEAMVDDAAPLFVQDETPTAEALYRATFFFDPNGFDPGEAQAHLRTRLFIGFDGAGRRAFALVLRRRNGDYALMGRVRLSDGGRAETGFVPLTDEPHLVEVLYAAESAPGAGNGGFLLTVDNVVVAVLDALDMGAPIERARLGALSVKGGAAGSLLFDGFDSRRSP